MSCNPASTARPASQMIPFSASTSQHRCTSSSAIMVTSSTRQTSFHHFSLAHFPLAKAASSLSRISVWARKDQTFNASASDSPRAVSGTVAGNVAWIFTSCSSARDLEAEARTSRINSATAGWRTFESADGCISEENQDVNDGMPLEYQPCS